MGVQSQGFLQVAETLEKFTADRTQDGVWDATLIIGLNHDAESVYWVPFKVMFDAGAYLETATKLLDWALPGYGYELSTPGLDSLSTARCRAEVFNREGDAIGASADSAALALCAAILKAKAEEV